MSPKRDRFPGSSVVGEFGSGPSNPFRSTDLHATQKSIAIADGSQTRKFSNPIQPAVKQNDRQIESSVQPVPAVLGYTHFDPNEIISDKVVNQGFGEFLRACAFCNKAISDNDTVYMYGYLGAYCSNTCRQNQINLDELDNGVSSESKKTKSEGRPL